MCFFFPVKGYLHRLWAQSLVRFRTGRSPGRIRVWCGFRQAVVKVYSVNRQRKHSVFGLV